MANKMLIDATHPEETRVVVLRGNRVEEFDFESANRRQLRGNIYLAKVTRVEPSLQAAFIDYGGNRHGFLAFSEIHPDYYQIPVADRQALIAEEERAHRDAEDEADRGGRRSRHHATRQKSDRVTSARFDAEPAEAQPAEFASEPSDATSAHAQERDETPGASGDLEATAEQNPATTSEEADNVEAPGISDPGDAQEPVEAAADHIESEASAETNANGSVTETEEEEVVESVGGADALEEVAERVPRFRRQYKIQEVIKRRQIMLVQVVKEERGTKGAALTTYLSLAGRYAVLMPNTARGGGISRKITKLEDRRRLKELVQELEVPEGMGVILRTAGAARTKQEIKRDFEYLLRVWETVRDLTLKSTAPTLVYEEGSLVRRSIRDLYNKDIDEVLVAGDDSFRDAKEFMRMLMPSHARNVQPYREAQPIFTRFGIESQLDAMFSPIVQLRSGGYIVLNQAEALVAIDVNSGRATREHHIEDTALKTNLEAAEEIARQLRLRDLAGLIVIDFIDMDEKRNNRSVERRLKECLKNDRARIQVGRISHFGLLEMSRQRIRTSVLESSTDKCPVCGGTGHVRSVASVALQLLRVVEETLLRGGTHNIIIRTREEVALYVLNHKRAHLRELEQRFHVTVTVNADASLAGQQPFAVERGEQVHSVEQARAIALQPTTIVATVESEDEDDVEEIEDTEGQEPGHEETDTAVRADGGDTHEGGGRRHRRRRRRGRHGEGRDTRFAREGAPEQPASAHQSDFDEGAEDDDAEAETSVAESHEPHPGQSDAGEGRRRRRRGRRGGRRARRGREGEVQDTAFENGAPAFEPELADAIADFGGPPPHSVPATPTPAHAQAEPATSTTPATVAHSEPPRRRSTVREPAPINGGGNQAISPSNAPEPVAKPPSAAPEQRIEEAPQPRKSGWWSRRSAGGDS
jgi:ribonuclease E